MDRDPCQLAAAIRWMERLAAAYVNRLFSTQLLEAGVKPQKKMPDRQEFINIVHST